MIVARNLTTISLEETNVDQEPAYRNSNSIISQYNGQHLTVVYSINDFNSIR